MTARHLRVVASNPEPAQHEPSEAVLRHLFTAEAGAEMVLRKVRELIALERNSFADRHNLKVRPSVDTLRRQFGVGK